MTRLTHISMGGTAAQSIAALIENKPDERQAVVQDCLNYGPLRDLHIPAGLATRAAWLSDMFKAAEIEAWTQGFEAHLGLTDFAQSPGPDERAMIWTGGNSMEQILLRATCHAWPQTQLWISDVAPLGADAEGRSAVGACSLETLRQAEASARPLRDDERAALAAEWRALTSANHLLHLYLDGKLRGFDENWFDEALLAQCESTFKRSIRVVGQVMGEARDYVTDTFLFYRLRALIERGLVEAQNGDAPIRELMVRKFEGVGSGR